MKNLIQYLVTSLVEYPGEVKIFDKGSETNPVYQIHVSRADLGKVIGKRGRTAKAMRLLVSTFATNAKKEVTLEIVEPEPNEPITT